MIDGERGTFNHRRVAAQRRGVNCCAARSPGRMGRPLDVVPVEVEHSGAYGRMERIDGRAVPDADRVSRDPAMRAVMDSKVTTGVPP